MRKLFVALSVVMLVVSACQKETSLENPNAIPGTGLPQPLGLLARAVFVAGTDSVATDYGYDASKRLVTMDVKATGGGNRFTRIVRNSTGIMTHYVTKSEDLVSEGIDSIVTAVQHDNTTNRYTRAVSTISIRGVPYSDSTVFTYNPSGNLSEKMSYAKIGSADYQVYRKTEYNYTATNVASEKYYSFDANNTWELDGTYNYSYDSRVNPVKLGEEAMIAIDDGSYFSLNNVSVMRYIDGADPAYNFTFTTTYTYGNDNKPASATVVEDPGSTSYEIRYYYK